MRISTSTFFASTLFGIRDQQSAIARLNQQIGSNQRLLAPKDDPVATTQVLRLGESIASRSQFLANQQKAELALKHEETLLSELHDTLGDVRGMIGNTIGSLDQTLRDQVATTLAGYYQHISALLNARDASGDYVFAGYNTDTQPYVHVQAYNPSSPGGPGISSPTGPAIDRSGQRLIEVDSGRTVPVNDDLNFILGPDSPADLLVLIDQVAINLHDSTMTSAALQTSLSSAYSALNTAIDGMTTVITAVAGRQVELSDVRMTTELFLQQERNALGELTEVDQAAAIIELQQRQVSLQAAESAFSLTSKLSLFNFL